jgi:hypothetical protein
MRRVIGEGQPRPVRRFALLVPVGLLLVAIASMQLGAAFAKGLFPRVGPRGATALRLTFSALILAAVRRPWRDLRLGRPAAGRLRRVAWRDEHALLHSPERHNTGGYRELTRARSQRLPSKRLVTGEATR